MVGWRNRPYEMQFLPQKSVKGQAVVDFLAEYPNPRATKLYEDLPDDVAEVFLPRHLSKDRYGNFSSTVLQELVREEMS